MTAITTTITKTTPVSTACVSHYWPIANKAVDDIISYHSATSNGSPRFTKDRFGKVDEALWIYSKETAWQLPPGRYIKGDTTLTMWIKKIECKLTGPYGIFYYADKLLILTHILSFHLSTLTSFFWKHG
jgi:hypothetical protein